MNVSIIIVTYNAMPWLKTCLESINYKLYKVLVIDNNSLDGTVDFIKESFPEIELYPQRSNLGFGKANNIGIGIALKSNADYVFLLNQDAYLEKNTLEVLINVHQKNRSFGILSPVHTNVEKNKLDANFSKYISFDKNENFYSDIVLELEKRDVYAVPFVNAAGWLIPRKILTNVGGFDPMFYHYGEDNNYCQRVLFHGYKIGVVPDSHMVHDRENRPKGEIKFGTKNYFERLERMFKVKYGNIHIDPREELKKYRTDRLKHIVMAVLKLKFKLALNFLKEIKIVNRIIPEIARSRNINKEKGPHYLKPHD